MKEISSIIEILYNTAACLFCLGTHFCLCSYSEFKKTRKTRWQTCAYAEHQSTAHEHPPRNTLHYSKTFNTVGDRKKGMDAASYVPFACLFTIHPQSFTVRQPFQGDLTWKCSCTLFGELSCAALLCINSSPCTINIWRRNNTAETFIVWSTFVRNGGAITSLDAKYSNLSDVPF